MSNSNVFNNNNFQKTPLESAYQFQTFSTFINNTHILSPKFSLKCIFCSSNNTVSLMNDGGSFRQCDQCKKQFKAIIINN